MSKHKTTIIKSTSPKLSDAYQKIITWFFSFPNSIQGLNGLSEQLSISKTTAKIIVESLVREGFLKKEELGKVWRITCNQQHPYNVTRKIAHNLAGIYESGIIEAIFELVPGAKAIILFGSYRKGDDVETSDIDVAAEIVGNEAPKIVELGILQSHGYRKNIKINLHVFSKNYIDINLFANIANGIVLAGFLEVRP
jgi:predicted nucleotidyltransferase